MSIAPRLGLITPGLTLAGPRDSHPPWERNATVDDIVAIAQTADRLGFDHITCSEHVGIPTEVEAVRGGRYYDPLSTFGYLAAKTERIRLTTHVLVLAYSHPLEIAKRYGTLDRLSGGRLVLGMGVGSLKQEFDLLGLGGAEFEERGARGDDALRALRASFGRREPEYRGSYYDFSGFIIDPCGLQQDVPFWIGGRSARSLRRAVELGDGWMPFGLTVGQMSEMIARAKDTNAWETRPKPLDFILHHGTRIDPIDQAQEAADTLARTFAAGATIVSADCEPRSLDHYLEQLEALAGLRL